MRLRWCELRGLRFLTLMRFSPIGNRLCVIGGTMYPYGWWVLVSSRRGTGSATLSPSSWTGLRMSLARLLATRPSSSLLRMRRYPTLPPRQVAPGVSNSSVLHALPWMTSLPVVVVCATCLSSVFPSGGPHNGNPSQRWTGMRCKLSGLNAQSRGRGLLSELCLRAGARLTVFFALEVASDASSGVLALIVFIITHFAGA